MKDKTQQHENQINDNLTEEQLGQIDAGYRYKLTNVMVSSYSISTDSGTNISELDIYPDY